MGTIIVVEGKSDTRRLKEIFNNIQTFETSGLGLDEDKIEQLKSLGQEYRLIVFTDPDGPGEIIRDRLRKHIPGLLHAYLPNDKALSSDKLKIGVEHAGRKDIEQALNNLYHDNSVQLDYQVCDLIEWGIYASKKKRQLFCNSLNIAYGNNQKVLKQLNSFAISKEQINQALKEIDGTS